MFDSKSTTVTINGAPVKIHAFSTGAVAVKTKFLEASRRGLFAQLDIIFNKAFTKYLPVWVWVIEHPEGIYVVDTGIISDVHKKGYFKILGLFSNWINTKLFKFKIERQEEIDKQLESFDISVSDVKALILTHLHVDHILGLKHFQGTEILVSKLEWEKPSGAVFKLHPTWFKPTLVDLNQKFATFENAAFLTNSKDLLLIHTPGHTHGHASVLLKTDQADIIFAGDICYYQQQLPGNKFAGANVSLTKTKNTYNNILNFAESRKVVFLPSHDENAAERLESLHFLTPMDKVLK